MFDVNFMAEGVDALVNQDGARALNWMAKFFVAAASGAAPTSSPPDAPAGDAKAQAALSFAVLAARRLSANKAGR